MLKIKIKLNFTFITKNLKNKTNPKKTNSLLKKKYYFIREKKSN